MNENKEDKDAFEEYLLEMRGNKLECEDLFEYDDSIDDLTNILEYYKKFKRLNAGVKNENT